MSLGAELKALARAAVKPTLPLFRAYARLVFGAGALEGLLLLAATFERPSSGALGLLAVLVARLVAKAAGYGRETEESGYFGYNSLLVGLSLAEAGPFGARLMLLVVAGAALAALITAVLGDLFLKHGLPVLALPFVLVTSLVWHTALEPGALPFWLAPVAPAASRERLVLSVLDALGAIVFCPTPLGGALVLAAAALHSRITAAALVAGAALGALVARGLGVSDAALVVPASYNAALTLAALAGAFFVPSRASVWTAAAGAALSAWLSLSLLLPFAPLSVPVLAWPFVLITLCVMRALALRPPGRAPVAAFLPAATPEANLEYARTFAKRLRLPGPPRFVLPVRGAWQITQGVHGTHTHRGPWAMALDFEVVDAEGFPFRDGGTKLEDYYAFGQVVVAPGTGVVAAVHDGMTDNPPGMQDLVRPWGNAVVIQHGPALYSVVAHLERGSMTVAPGQAVTAGEPVGRCGASGRSPRPHVHFQVQASPVLGAPTLAFYLVNYAVLDETPRFERLGVPAEGETVQTPDPEPLAPGEEHPFLRDELVLVDARGRRAELRHELSLFGEYSLVDAERGERLYWVPYAGGVVFTALRGSSRGVLGAILQIAPILPAVAMSRLRFDEELPPEPLLPLALRPLYQLLALFFEPASARVEGELVRTRGAIVVESECTVRFFGRTVRRRRGRLELDRTGLRRIALGPARFGAHPELEVERARLPESLVPLGPHERGAPTCVA